MSKYNTKHIGSVFREGDLEASSVCANFAHTAEDGKLPTLLFLEYLWRNGMLTRPDGRPRLADNAMVALALLVAESEPSQKYMMIRLTLNFLEDGS